MLGIDVSHHQGHIDWHAVRAAGIEFAWIRATYGATGSDDRYAENAAGATAAGVPWGAYHFNGPGDPVAQAGHFLRAIGDVRHGGLRYALDTEHDPTHGWSPDAAWARAFLETLAHTSGLTPVHYATKSDFLGVFNVTELVRYPRWVARVKDSAGNPRTPGDTGVSPFVAHQFSWVGKVKGINANVDLDFAPSLMPLLVPGHVVAPPPAPKPTPKPKPAKGRQRPKNPGYPGRPLRNGSRANRSKYVEAVQGCLNAWGARLKVDGRFGNLTEGAVREFQGRHGLRVDGVVGPRTWAALWG